MQGGSLIFDSKEVCNLVCNNAEFAGFMAQCTHEDITKVIREAVHTLFCMEPPCTKEERKGFSVGVCVTIQLISQWLTRFMCKQILQLTKPEVICLYQKHIPSSYIISYVKHQYHFNLKSLLESKFSELRYIRT